MIVSEKNCDLIVIGSGMAGLAAALFAAGRGISTMVIGHTGRVRFFSGLIDLMSVYPISTGKTWEDPWAAIHALSAEKEHPHPYSRIHPAGIKKAMDEFLAFLSKSGLPYHLDSNQNQSVITSQGTLKQTFALPHTMAAGVEAFQKKAPCLIIRFPEVKGFSSRQIQETMKRRWPLLRSIDLSFPGCFHELFPEHAARELESPSCLENIVKAIQPHLKKAEVVGVPAILGIEKSMEVHADLEKRLGVRVFEIPCLPPSMPGLRLQMVFQHQLARLGVQAFFQQQVDKVTALDTGGFLLYAGEGMDQIRIHARGVILATGRFFSKGLAAERTGIRETVFNLPVHQPENRTYWHNPDFLACSGHAINTAGIEIDDSFHPLDQSGQPAFPSLFAAGSILAHQDWIRMKCGSGLSIATAYAAVEAFQKQVNGHDL
ncbi:MAG: anaerobic glycerol-3-phosphate dehydrogenase subunit B [Deltaproteobacteria bacterium]|nr:MAG: anaerobic glycerol-3-phosphate dehydrogenase subunit B [Deltaproteobacteria bacterium]